MKELRLLNYFLGLEVSFDTKGYYMSWEKYIGDLVSQAGLTNDKTTPSPLEANAKFSSTDGSLLKDVALYYQLVGSRAWKA